ncbi:hypothetical protein EKG37_21200 [Robertmurraya yapensis]|uniref:Uncharacterized protein n=1 Tax=Bacillus yapensis TaxID=2492960 RepID=A0A3S0L432_9BACI|nr:hypothetical protein [Bacillus yapensis]RTR26588.1 hypothetical protein EKG37_21200 [Bacillus yapensis]TKS93763.1 hypothetical protein FAR12_21205 [Bacillus yapensis]
MKKNEIVYTAETLNDMTMELLIKRLTEESPHLSSPEHGHGILEIIYTFNSPPRISDKYSIISNSGGDFEVLFPTKNYDELFLKNNIRYLYYIITRYLATRIVPQGKLTVEFQNGKIINCTVNNEGTYKDLERSGKPKLNIDDFLSDDEEEE